jgi:hypothetical protein
MASIFFIRTPAPDPLKAVSALQFGLAIQRISNGLLAPAMPTFYSHLAGGAETEARLAGSMGARIDQNA